MSRGDPAWGTCLAAAGLVASALALEEPPPEMSPGARRVDHDPGAFAPDPEFPEAPYEGARQLEIYGGKHSNETQRPWLELGRELYREGPFRPGRELVGERNLVFWHFMTYGDWRWAAAHNDNGAVEQGQAATRLNLDLDLKLTATERLHALLRPLDEGGEFTRLELSGQDRDAELELDANPDTLYLEGDLSALAAGLGGRYPSWDLPVAVGLMPLVFQNGVWVEDALTGAALAIPARHSRVLDVSNMDLVLFAGLDEVTTAAVLDRDGRGSDRAAQVYGVTAFVEANQGYWELGYGYTRDASAGDQDVHGVAAAFTRRYRAWLSSSLRAVACLGQDRETRRPQNADGVILLSENSLITRRPLALVPYLNAFAGFDRPQSLARDAGAGGILKNTGLAFETDGLTGFPRLDDTGQDTWGGALGVEYLFDLDQQLVLEVAALDVMGDEGEPGRPARARQEALSLRWQRPLGHAWILRADIVAAAREDDEDVRGARLELRWKF
ncbi:MAG: hypothetical protein HY722_07495 [Planctomycetes bacterium]|nr:hypothetical protein [Planctomycetota bacterium]